MIIFRLQVKLIKKHAIRHWPLCYKVTSCFFSHAFLCYQSLGPCLCQCHSQLYLLNVDTQVSCVGHWKSTLVFLQTFCFFSRPRKRIAIKELYIFEFRSNVKCKSTLGFDLYSSCLIREASQLSELVSLLLDGKHQLLSYLQLRLVWDVREMDTVIHT